MLGAREVGHVEHVGEGGEHLELVQHVLPAGRGHDQQLATLRRQLLQQDKQSLEIV